MRTLSFVPLLFLLAGLTAQVSTYAVFDTPTLAVQPPDRERAQMAFDEVRGRMLLAGGIGPGATVRQDTWEWTGTTWVQITPATQLNFTQQVRLVWSPQRGQVLAVTGDNTWNGPPMKIWGWTGTNWTLINANGPISRADAYEIAWDSQRGVLVMFGTPFSAETWEWNGTVWAQRGTGGPLPRSGHRMVYDAARHVVVLHGGVNQSGQSFNDTWEWNGVYWLERFGITAAPLAISHAIAYDAARQRVVLHGGYFNGNPTGAVYEFDGANWTLCPTSTGPASMLNANMAFVPATGRLFLFGGNDGSAWYRTRTIAFVTGHVAGSVVHQPGCLGPSGVPTLAALAGSRPVLGQTFQLRFTNLPNTPLALVFAALGYSDQAWSGVPLPIDLTPLGFTSCLLRIEPAVLEPLANVAGVANWSIPVPNNAALDGVPFFLQGLVLTPGFNPGGGVTSSSLRGTAGIL